jgi:uncharacterized membrane protein YraQ (UPF0718 family)
MEIMRKIGDEIVKVFIDAAPYVLLGLLLAGVFGGLIRRAWVMRQLGGRSFWAVIKAAALGAPLPICSCGVIPTTVGLRRAGAGRPAAMSFLISTPETGVDSITVTWFLINPLMTVARPVVAIFSAMIGGLAAIFLDKEKPAKTVKPDAASGDCCCDAKEEARDCCAESAKTEAHSCCEVEAAPKGACCESEREEDSCCCDTAENAAPPAPISESDDSELSAQNSALGFRPRIERVFAFGFGEVLGSIAPWLLVGLLLAGAAGALIPQDFFTSTVSDPWAQMGLMALIATPLYLCSVSTTPVAAMLMLKGMHPGAALVLLTLGPATNITTIIVIWREFGARFASIYLGTILAVSVAAGAGLNAISAALGGEHWWTASRMAAAHAHEHAGAGGQPAWAVMCALALVFLLAYHLIVKRWMSAGERSTTKTQRL